MNDLRKYFSMCLLATSALLVGTSPAWAHGSGDGLPGTASGFTVLGGPHVACTNTPQNSITGDVGVDQGTFANVGCTINGTVHEADAAAQAAYAAFLSAYTALTPALGECTTTNTITGTLAGKILTPGVYCISDEAKAGVLILCGPANGTWVFKANQTADGALTGTGFSVIMAGGGQACNVTWWVPQASTMTDSTFVGTILAGAAITMTRGTLAGRAFAKDAVTITGTNIIGCSALPGPPPSSCKDKDHDGHDGHGKDHKKCNQGVGNGPEGCDPGKSDVHWPFRSNDEHDGNKPGRKGGR